MKKYIILISIYNDWESVSRVLQEIDLIISKWDANVSALIVNDASTEKRMLIKSNFNNIKSLRVMNMKKNRGHARCNAAGLKFLTEKENFDYVILMDGDGEDQPKELNLLFKKSKENSSKVITANRVKRSENALFKLLYECHKILTYVFTGKSIKFGNYGCLPREAVTKLIKDPSIWSSYSGSLAKIISNRAVTELGKFQWVSPTNEIVESDEVELLVRPDDFLVLPNPSASVQVTSREYRGDAMVISAELGSGNIIQCRQGPYSDLPVGTSVDLVPSRSAPFVAF